MRELVYPYVAELRPLNCLMAACAALIGILVSKVTFTVDLGGAVILTFGAVFLVAAGGNVVNDYFDVSADQINRPHRALPSGQITKQAALLYAITLSLLGILIALLINPACFGLAAVNAVLLLVYSWKLKQSPLIGNLLVGYLTGSVFLFGGAAVSSVMLPGLLFISAMLAITSREIVKDVEDLRGDRLAGASTLPIRFGIQSSLLVAAFFMLAAVAISPLPYVTSAFGLVYIVIVAVADVVLLSGVVLSWRDPSRASSLMKYGMLVVLLSYIVGAL